VRSRFTTVMIGVACLAWLGFARTQGQESLTLENSRVGLGFDRSTGSLVAIQNKLTGETYSVRGDEFTIETAQCTVAFSQLKPVAVYLTGDTFTASYEGEAIHAEVAWTLDGLHHFAEKRMTLTCARNCGLKNVILSRPTFAADGLRIVPYRYPKFQRKPGEEPSCTFFGRTPKGGLFTGVEVPFDASAADGQQVVLCYAPSLKIAAGEKVVCEPVYFGVYRRGLHDTEQEDVLCHRSPTPWWPWSRPSSARPASDWCPWPAAGTARWSNGPTPKSPWRATCNRSISWRSAASIGFPTAIPGAVRRRR